MHDVVNFIPYVVPLSCQRNANCTIVIGGRCGRPVALAIEAWYQVLPNPIKAIGLA
ncbi:MAG: hypothetical protein OXC62_06655 [Aestuariivita sp.]|nr:hypothetical protein [Aestuariivita sp.]